jgi:hypothetical protein
MAARADNDGGGDRRPEAEELRNQIRKSLLASTQQTPAAPAIGPEMPPITAPLTSNGAGRPPS